MIIRIQTLEQLKQAYVRALLSRTDKVTKITDGSILNGHAFGVAKLGQKILKDVALVSSHFFPDNTYGQYLDSIAEMYGIAPRFGALESTTYLRIHASPGTTYVAGTHSFIGLDGINFILETDFTVGAYGFGYAKVKSQTTGSKSNVEPLSINRVVPTPSGHQFVINDYPAQYGRDIEDDDAFRIRIKNANNIAARNNIAMLEQIFGDINPNVLRIFNQGTNGVGKIRLAIASQNGADFTNNELEQFLTKAREYFALSELNPDGLDYVGVELVNVTWQPIDISCRVKLDSSMNQDIIRKEIQVRLQQYLDYRYWQVGNKVEWDDLLQVVKQTEGVLYVSDQFFMPRLDIAVDPDKLPRLRDFEMRDLEGNIILSFVGTLNPTYFPNSLDFNYIATVLASL